MQRIVLDTNVLVSSLLNKQSKPYLLYRTWNEGKYILVTSPEQLEELERVLSYPKLRKYINESQARTMVSGLWNQADVVSELPYVEYSNDLTDNRIIATAIAGKATYLVTGDKRDLLHLVIVENIQIVTVHQMLAILQSPSG
ncbi:putative toxin-antitoxin system toxin component, PIN family [Aetokthonos hydrillicola Thurmond2011]|uniref:Toxin-antitoxin system toxin component, PIN family n=1 Tax=Aetokthonos hydrillicola Thurmond2011 TaxID=2712845 RepID=A0AAP5M8I8_9CYAN|nr:putative toxin-antitoxin system toxin component, PIN family [Aetokthonos hydrillicola]MBO3462301.1 putative toxin-antitoxin system toxin component, PIN family [Aetokthonos hydrillicola CCALA 1050]MBW4590812.1 putative toxin-antitoxin system toxin component, PIN family [Aetokthonos hydrillicola CCALA 1050]MDR9893643.1 putative toxin-antitoxin system toxin component, PIN family [Aetokthonos hydrillicola Thurmond2011]